MPGGAVIYSGAAPVEYQVVTKLLLTQSGGTYVQYLRASADACSGPAPAGVCCPAATLGNSNTTGELGYVMPIRHWAMPSRYHSIRKNDLALAMVAQPEQAFLPIAQGDAPKKPTVKILKYREVEPFFVKGESDEL